MPTTLHLIYLLSITSSCFSVCPVVADDIDGVVQLVAGLEGADSIVSDVTQYTVAKRDSSNEGGTPLSAVVAKCTGQVVGVAVVRTEQVQVMSQCVSTHLMCDPNWLLLCLQEMGYIKSHYNIEDFIYFNHYHPCEHAHLNHFILNPVFAPYGKHMLKVGGGTLCIIIFASRHI